MLSSLSEPTVVKSLPELERRNPQAQPAREIELASSTLPRPALEMGHWTPELIAARMEKIVGDDPSASLAAMFPSFRPLSSMTRVMAYLFSGDDKWVAGSTLGSVLTMGNTRLPGWLFGQLASLESPRWLARAVMNEFVTTLGITREDLGGKSIDDFACLQKLFTRQIEPGSRPIADTSMVSPVDGYIKGFGALIDGRIPQNIKGEDFTAERFIASREEAARMKSWLNMYLSPNVYHGVHAPFDGKIIDVTYIPGTVWPVNRWAHAHVDDLYCKQERFVISMDTERFGRAAVVMVAATNVGGMRFDFDGGLKPRIFNPRAVERKHYEDPIEVRRGERLGMFEMGSTVVVLCEARDAGLSIPPVELDREVLKVKLGEPFTRE